MLKRCLREYKLESPCCRTTSMSYYGYHILHHRQLCPPTQASDSMQAEHLIACVSSPLVKHTDTKGVCGRDSRRSEHLTAARLTASPWTPAAQGRCAPQHACPSHRPLPVLPAHEAGAAPAQQGRAACNLVGQLDSQLSEVQQPKHLMWLRECEQQQGLTAVPSLTRRGVACSTSAVSTAKNATCSCVLAPVATAVQAFSATKRSTACAEESRMPVGCSGRAMPGS